LGFEPGFPLYLFGACQVSVNILGVPLLEALPKFNFAKPSLKKDAAAIPKPVDIFLKQSIICQSLALYLKVFKKIQSTNRGSFQKLQMLPLF